MRSRHSRLAVAAAGVGGAAVAGFGLTLGRDVYRAVKPGRASPAMLLLLAASAICLPLVGGVAMSQGYRRGLLATAAVTVGSSLLMIAVGFGLIYLFAAAFVAETALGGLDHAVLASAATAGLAAVGVMIGLARRRPRAARFATIEHNDRFMSDNGLQETGGSEVTHYDAAGTPLRLLEAGPQQLVFMAVGRRGRRAYIHLDERGRMRSYSGVV